MMIPKLSTFVTPLSGNFKGNSSGVDDSWCWHSNPQQAKAIASKFSKELGFVNLAALIESDKRRELEVNAGIGFAHFHHRRNGQTTIYSLAVTKFHQGNGWEIVVL